MKTGKYAWLLLFIILAVAPWGSSAGAAAFDVGHFNGVAWGSRLPAKGFRLELDAKDGWKFYKRPADRSMIEGIKTEDLFYKATRGKFDAAHFTFSGDANYQKARALMAKTFGPSKQTNAGREIYRLDAGPKAIYGMLQYVNGSGLANFYQVKK